MQDIHKLAPPHLLRGRLQHAEEREEKVAERMPRGGKPERRGVHPMERCRSPVWQFTLQIFELNRQDVDDVERPAAPFNALGKTRSELSVTARYLQGLSGDCGPQLLQDFIPKGPVFSEQDQID